MTHSNKADAPLQPGGAGFLIHACGMSEQFNYRVFARPAMDGNARPADPYCVSTIEGKRDIGLLALFRSHVVQWCASGRPHVNNNIFAGIMFQIPRCPTTPSAAPL